MCGGILCKNIYFEVNAGIYILSKYGPNQISHDYYWCLLWVGHGGWFLDAKSTREGVFMFAYCCCTHMHTYQIKS